MDKFVVDSGPFIHLEQIGQLKLLKNLPRLFIPASVISEIKQGDIAGSQIKSIEDWANVEIFPTQRKFTVSITQIIRKARLQHGESDCIYLALQIQPCVMLTDDLSARVAAEKLSIEVHGSIGLIAYSLKRKWISIETAEESLNLLYHRSSLFVTYAIIDDAIRRLKKPI